MTIKKHTKHIKYSKDEILRIVNDAYEREEIKEHLERVIKAIGRKK